jgi:HD domain
MATLTRRTVLSMVLSVGVSPRSALAVAAEEASALPTEVAGITIPRSRIAVLAAQFARRSCPEFLFNHCMRTFLFGALALQRQGLAYNADEAFTAAAFHDLGLLPAFASASQGFEVDGANAAEKFARDNGLNAVDANVIWHGVALHDGRFAITRRAGPEAMLVALGAGSDVDGPDLDSDEEKKQLAAIVTAFPRLQFKKRFTSLLVDHCQRKPKSQRGTWLEGLCREHVPGAWTDTIEREIAAAPFSE